MNEEKEYKKQNALYLDFIKEHYVENDPLIREMVKDACREVNRGRDKIKYLPYIKDMKEKLVDFVDQRSKSEENNYTKAQINDVARDLVRYYSSEICESIKERKEHGSISRTALVSTPEKIFDKEIEILRRFLGALKVMRHPVMKDTMVIYSKAIGTLNRVLLIRMEVELRRFMPEYQLTNIWKNDPIYTAKPDKGPNYTGGQFLWRKKDHKTKVIHIDVPSMSIVLREKEGDL